MRIRSFLPLRVSLNRGPTSASCVGWRRSSVCLSPSPPSVCIWWPPLISCPQPRPPLAWAQSWSSAALAARSVLPSNRPKGETVPDSLPATPKSPPTRRVPPRGTHLPKAKQLETKLEGAREAPSVGAYILVVTDTRKSAANPTSDPAKRDPRDSCAPGQGLKAGSAAEWSGESRGG